MKRARKESSRGRRRLQTRDNHFDEMNIRNTEDTPKLRPSRRMGVGEWSGTLLLAGLVFGLGHLIPQLVDLFIRYLTQMQPATMQYNLNLNPFVAT